MCQITSREVDPLSDMLKAVVELNWHRARADAAGWNVELIIDAKGDTLYVSVSRKAAWPTPDGEPSQ